MSLSSNLLHGPAISTPQSPSKAAECCSPYSKYHRPPLPPPHILATLVPDSPAFAELKKIEQKLDWTLLRKKAEINDALGRPTRVNLWLIGCITYQADGALSIRSSGLCEFLSQTQLMIRHGSSSIRKLKKMAYRNLDHRLRTLNPALQQSPPRQLLPRHPTPVNQQHRLGTSKWATWPVLEHLSPRSLSPRS